MQGEAIVIELKLVILILYVTFLVFYARTITMGRTLAGIRKKEGTPDARSSRVRKHRRSAFRAVISIALCVLLIEGMIRAESGFDVGRGHAVGDYLFFFHLFCSFMFVGMTYLALRPYTGLRSPALHRWFAYGSIVSALFMLPSGLVLLWMF